MIYLVTAIYALFELLITLLLRAAIWIASQIVNTSITTFCDGVNIFEVFINLFTVNNQADAVHSSDALIGVLTGIGDGFLAVMCLISIIRSFAEASTGKEVRHPLAVAGKGLIAFMIYVLFFGTGFTSYNGLLATLGVLMGKLMNLIAVDFSNLELVQWTVTGDVATYLGVCLMYATLLSSVIGAAVSYIERIVTFALTALMGPICISMYAYSETENTAKQWISSILVQFGCIFVSLAMWSIFLLKLGEIVIVDSGNHLFKVATLVVILNLMKNAEVVFNELGFHTVPNIDSARSVAAGFSTMMSIASKVTPFMKKISGFMQESDVSTKSDTTIEQPLSNKNHIAEGGLNVNKQQSEGNVSIGPTMDISTMMGDNYEVIKDSGEIVNIQMEDQSGKAKSLAFQAQSLNPNDGKNEPEVFVKSDDKLLIGSKINYKGTTLLIGEHQQINGRNFYTTVDSMKVSEGLNKNEQIK